MSIDPSMSDWWEAHQQFLLGNKQASLEVYEKLASEHPDNAVAFLMLGNAKYSLGRLEEAMAEFEKALAAQPDFGQAHYRMGVTAFRAGYLTKAIESFRRNLTGPGQRHVMSYYWIGIIEFFLGHDEAAIQAFRSLREESPESRFVNLFMAELLIKRGKHDEALGLLRELVDRTPDLPKAHYLLGEALKRLYRPVEALKSFRRALELDPSDARARAEIEMLS